MAKQAPGAVTGGLISGAVAVVLAWTAQQLHIVMPPEVASAWAVLLVAGGSLIGHRLTRKPA